MQIKIATLVNIVVLGTLSGLTFCVQLGLIKVLATFNASVYIQVIQGMIPPLTAAAKPLMIAGLITFLVRLVTHKEKWSLPHYLVMVSFLFFIAGGLTTIFGNFPINNRFMASSIENPPAEWQHLREQWNQFNSWRFVFAQLSFITGLLSLLFYQPGVVTKKQAALSGEAMAIS